MLKIANALSRMIRAGKLSDKALLTLGIQKHKPQTILDKIKNTLANAPEFLQRFIPSEFKTSTPKLSDQYRAIMDNGAAARSYLKIEPWLARIRGRNNFLKQDPIHWHLNEIFNKGISEWKSNVANAPKLKNPKPNYSTNPQYDWKKEWDTTQGPMPLDGRKPLTIMHPKPEDYNPFFSERTLKATNFLPRVAWGEGNVWLNLPNYIKNNGFYSNYAKNVWRPHSEPKALVREALVPDLKMLREKIKNFSPELQKKILDTAKAITRHELGHDKASQLTAEQAQKLMDIIHNKLGKTYKLQPGSGFSREDSKHMLHETLAHWFATRGENRAAKAAIDFPIAAAMEKNPKLVAKWEQDLQGLPENLKRRLLAIRSHNFVNYSMQ